LQPYFSAGENSTEQLLHDKIMNEETKVHEAQEPALNKGAVIKRTYTFDYIASAFVKNGRLMGRIKSKCIEAENEAQAILIFKEKHPNVNFDPPY